jgi:ribosome-associated protein
MNDLRINESIVIPESYLRIITSRSSGPGGQNVNKLNTRITVVFDVSACPMLTEDQKVRILKKLASYADKDGCLQVSSQQHRSQYANRLDAMERLSAMVVQALKPPVKRYKTSVPKAAIRKRLEQKKQRSQLKKQRSIQEKDL